MTQKFVDGAGLSHFKSKIDDNFLDKKKGGTVEKSVAFKDTISVTNSATLGTVLTNGIKIPTNKVVEGVNKVWDYQGNVVPVGKANGLATLNAEGKIPLEQLGNIDTTFVEVLTDVSKLPTTNIGKHIYLVPDGTTDKNKYVEYVYTGTLPISTTNVYDASKWEKLGEFQAEIDLTPYSKKVDTVNGVTAGANDASNIKLNVNKNGTNSEVKIPSATTSVAGAMSAADKSILNKLAAQYPFNIASFGASPNVIEAGVAATINLTWDYSNKDFHSVSSQVLNSNPDGSGDITGNVTVANDIRKYTTKTITGAKSAKNTFAFTLRAKADGSSDEKTRTCTVTSVHASYCGVVDASKTSLTPAEIIGTNGVGGLGNKAVLGSKNRSVTITQNNQKLVYAYPSYFDTLTSIKDGNGFQGFSGYTKTTVEGVNGTTYFVYIQKTAATANGTYTFA